ncbi:MAG: DUF4160 domain-containing protein [Planctomycetes bacterium]|nr:DUF4160 domain-containing protein [Planctomycetota bacterium]
MTFLPRRGCNPYASPLYAHSYAHYAHFHARYRSDKVSIDIRSLSVLDGRFPPYVS